MGKRVGMTTNVEERKTHWIKEYPNLRNWKIVKNRLTYDEAQNIENKYKQRGYEGHAGGEKKSGRVYSVYTFEY